MRISVLIIGCFFLQAAIPGSKSADYSLRKYSYVRDFYAKLSEFTVKLAIEKKLPPAAILAIAGHESGYGRGYVSRITGNILSLGAQKGEIQLPALYLAVHRKSGKVLLDSVEIAKYHPRDIKWEQRPPSFKKDYRPQGIAGSTKRLAYFRDNPQKAWKANQQSIRDFMNNWICENSHVPAFRSARRRMDSLVTKEGTIALFKLDHNVGFIYQIGGKPRSFNHRPQWRKKVVYILKRAGLNELCLAIHAGRSFTDAWKERP